MDIECGDGGYRVDTSIVNEVHMYGHGGLACGHDSLEQVCGHGLAYLKLARPFDF